MSVIRLQYKSFDFSATVIPPEVLSSIFTLAIADITAANEHTSKEGTADILSAVGKPLISAVRSIYGSSKAQNIRTQSILQFLLVVCHVCHEWRTETLNNSSLWSTIHYDRNINDDALSFWIARASTQPLDIQLYLSPEHDHHIQWGYRHSSHVNIAKRDTRLMRALNILATHCEQWRSLTVIAKCTFDLMHVVHHLESITSAPQLGHLEIRGDQQECISMISGDDERWYKRPKVFFQGSHPILNDVRLYCVPTTWCNQNLSSYLHAFSIESGPPNRAQRDETLDVLLKGADKLHTLSVKADRSYIFSNGGIHLPFLTRLDVEFTDAEFALDFLSAIQTSNIKVLYLALSDDDFSAVLEQISRRSSDEDLLSKVEDLIIRNLNASIISMNMFLRRLVSVRRITFMTTFIGYKIFFKSLVANGILPQALDVHSDLRSSDTTVFCPMLSTFFSCGLTGSEVMDLVKARRSIGHPLDEVHITMDDYVHPNDHSWLCKEVRNFSSRSYYNAIRNMRNHYI